MSRVALRAADVLKLPGEIVLMSTRLCLLVLCTSIAVLGSVSATRSQAVEALNGNAVGTDSPRVSASPAQPP